MIQANRHLWSILIWGGIQVALLGACVGGIPLWLGHPFPRQTVSLQVIWCGQILFAALLFPILFRNSGAALICFAMMGWMDELAGLLSNGSQFMIARGFLCVGLWMMGLAGLAWIITDDRHLLILGTLAILLTAGGTILDYLRWEQHSTFAASSAFKPISLLPNLCAAATSNSTMPWQWALVPLIILFLVGIYKWGVMRASTSLHNAG